MAAAAGYDGERVRGQGLEGARRHGRGRDVSYSIAVDPGIPVRRYGTVPPLEDEAAWMVEPLASEEPPRTIAEIGGAAVFLAAMGAAAVAGWVLYLR